MEGCIIKTCFSFKYKLLSATYKTNIAFFDSLVYQLFTKDHLCSDYKNFNSTRAEWQDIDFGVFFVKLFK